MKAIVSTRYGAPNVLQLKDIEKPVPKYNEILIKIHATTVTQGDRRFRIPDPFTIRLINGLIRPKLITILGLELAGEVEVVGIAVKHFMQGDRVFGFTGFYFGAYAEYKCMQEDGSVEKNGILTKMPANLSFEEAAAIPCGGLTALGLLKKANIQKGQRVLVYGASGSVGTFLVQLAKYFGGKVTGVCSTSNLKMIESLGADWVIDYTKNDLSKSKMPYDLIIDAVHKMPLHYKKLLDKRGIFLSAHSSSNPQLEDLIFLKELAEEKKIHSVIDKHYSLEQIVEAHRYVDLGHKKGNVVVTIGH
jgi:NADPH:quinone reductase-like Zn-dependent oxidoreductase